MSYSGDEFVRLLMGAEIPGLLWSDTPLFFDDDRSAVSPDSVSGVLGRYIVDAPP